MCTADGRVLGCVDVNNPAMLSLSNQSLKHSLLSQVASATGWWTRPTCHMPPSCGGFSGREAAHIDTTDTLDHRLRDTAGSLQAAVTRRRVAHRERILATDIDPTALSDEGPATRMMESRLPSGWEQNSFVTPLDSRMADLN